MSDPAAAADLTWPALLAQWTQFAQSSLALPRNAEGDRWRAAVAPIIALQSLTHALADLDRLAGGPDQRALALDTADLLIARHTSDLHALWRGEPLHPEIESIISDARAARAAAKERGLEWLVASDRLIADHPADLVASLLASGFDGDLMLPAPGVPLFPTCPCAFLRGRHGSPPDDHAITLVEHHLAHTQPHRPRAAAVSGPAPVPGPRMAYRQFDFSKGGPVRDVVSPMSTSLPAGQPLLLWAIQNATAQPVPLPLRSAVAESESAPALPVLFE
ncbi:MAG: hypothetical protein KF745_06530 [Phycisphaeraceae bacterium]|nr:hypothetical protein [Phycisphaeraceae bacterium]